MKTFLDYNTIIVSFTGSGLSVLCVFVLLITWYLLPQWRSLQNYICLNQIITGTVFQCSFLIIIMFDYSETEISYYVLIISVCWSLCSSMLAYLRLVLVYVGKISCEKRKATVFTYGIAGIIIGICDVLIPKLINLHVYFSIFPLLFMTIINFFIFIRIIMSVLSCGKTPMSKRNIRHIISLIAVAFICDSLLIALFFFIILSSLLVQTVFGSIIFLFSLKLIFQTLFVLLRTSTRMHWKLYLRKRERRNQNLSNNIEL